uniref:MARVEL domain-containing protein n=1 Tax=Elaeophora elaphi TaxID=1147741 RepID=A0A0R3RYZ2_9BILA
LQTAGVIVAVTELIICILAIYGLIRNLQLFGAYYLLWFIIGITSVIVLLIVIALLLYAIKTENGRLLIPHLSAQIFLIFFLIIVAFVVTLLLIFGAYRGIRNLLGHASYHITDDATITLGYMIIGIYLAMAVLEMLFLYIIYRLYKHLNRYLLIASDDPFSKKGPRHHIYTATWHMPPKTAADGSGSPDAGHLYPYSP